MSSRIFRMLCTMAVVSSMAGLVFGQNPPAKQEQKQGEKKSEKKSERKTAAGSSKDVLKNPTAEQIAEASIFVYGLGGGRAILNQIRKTAIERGKTTVTTADGTSQQATFSRWTQRGDSLIKEKIRLDQDFPSARYALVFNEARIYGIYNDSVFTPRDDATRTFENQIIHGIEALLRYKENESTLVLVGKEKLQAVEYHVIDVTDKAARKTRFYISTKSYRVMMLDYEDQGTKYRRKFYDYNYAQGTLVPFRTVLWASDKIVEETEIGTVTFGQKIDGGLFAS
ncbi:MAG: hypothetical protein ABR535_00445 [Pyrinomonadaceae bacterium]